MSLTKTLAIERKYDIPSINIKSSNNTIGKRIIVQFGTNWKTGINPKKTPISTSANNPIAAVATTGKNSILIFTDLIIPLLALMLIRPPAVPLMKIWKRITPVIK